jgi:hypothetical protein
VTTYVPPDSGSPSHTMISAAWLAALLRDVAIVVAVVVYAIDTL